MEYILAPSILSADFLKLGEQINMVSEAGAKYLHFDVMDGLFVPNISFGIPVLKCIKGKTNLVLDVHLMIVEPDRYFEKFKEAGAQILTVHLETLKNPEESIKRIRELGMKPSISIKPATPVEEVFPYLEMIDQVLVMTVEPGAGAQPYIEYCTDKIKTVREEINKCGLKVDVQVDGGINQKTIKTVIDAGANVFVMGSSVFNDNPYESAKMYVEMIK